jgi:hypothetical protein
VSESIISSVLEGLKMLLNILSKISHIALLQGVKANIDGPLDGELE